MDLLSQYILKGDLIGFLSAIYMQSMGQYFYVLLVLVVLIPVYMKSQSLTYCYLILVFAGAGTLLSGLLPLGSLNVAHVLLALGGGGLLYRLFSSR